MAEDTGFPAVKQSVIAVATNQALKALRDKHTPRRVAEFYDPESNYAGATFTQLQPRVENVVTAVDLLATTTLSVKVPPRAVRRILEDEVTAAEVSRLLEALPTVKLEYASVADFDLMCEFYDYLKASLAQAGTKSSNAWVTASKIAARKRPGLFPVRDRVVCRYLGILHLNDRAKDWYVFRELLSTPEILDELNELPVKVRKASEGTHPVIEPERLRLFDAALWRFAPKRDEQA